MSTGNKILETRSITKEEAERCANEQIQHIGNVQPHGFLLVVHAHTLNIVQYSENMLSLINKDCQQQLADDTPILGTHLSSWLQCDLENPFESLVPSAMQIFHYGGDGIISESQWECLGVIVGEYVSLEFFPATSKLDSYQLILNLDRMVNRIKSSRNTEELFQIVTHEFQKHTDYDRVMLYRFMPDWTGEVVAEVVSDRTEIKFLGLRFPAEDIPKQARELYKTSALRILADVDATPAAVVPTVLPCGALLDQSVSVLRGVSPMHIAYLRNMGVKASMSIALMSGRDLWGLVAFHHYSPKVPPHHLVSEMKASCELFADIVISHLHPALSLELISRAVALKQLIETTFYNCKKSGFELELIHSALVSLFPSMGKALVGVCIKDQCFFVSDKGDWQPGGHFNRVLHSYIDNSGDNYFEADCLLQDQKRRAMPGCPSMAGIIARRSKLLPELIVFFGAQEVIREITWGGKPQTINIVMKDGERGLEPRGSFDLWCEKVIGCSDEWREEDRLLLNDLLVHCEDFVVHSQSEKIKSTLHETSFTDTLTGLPNRRFMEKHFASLVEQNDENKTITVYFIDLDNFKRINDYLGHHSGDKLLKVISQRISHCVRPDDMVARLGGDEFVVVVRHSSNVEVLQRETSLNIANKIIAEVGRPVFDDAQAMITTPSIGAVICNPTKIDFSEILKRSDIAMYRAKNAGKNRVHFFSEKDQSKVNFEVQLELDLRQCLENRQLQVYFQKKVDSSGRIVGAEALARWNHPELGPISPQVFIDLAEKNNLIVELGDQILESVCQQLAKWRTQPGTDADFVVAVNVSPVQLLADKFEQKFHGTLDKYQLPKNSVRIEITETLFMQNFDQAKVILESLRRCGVTISLDDFGTGYSSLSYLWKLPIDEVKIDRSFISNIANDEESLTMIEGIISLCRKLRFTVVAEGVEEKVQFALLSGMDCDCFQGYYFGRPEAADKFNLQDDS